MRFPTIRPEIIALSPVAAMAALLAFNTVPVKARSSKPPAGFAPTLPVAPARSTTGAIFDPAGGYSSFIEGTRAHRVGDALTVMLLENTVTSKSAGSKTSRDGSVGIVPPTAGPFAINPNALNASGSSSFNGQGNATQSDSFSGSLSVTIAEVRPNGTVLVKGEKRMMLSQGHEWIQFSGIVRLADIDTENQVLSTQVADAHIEYSGNGSIQRASREGWLSKFFNMLTPF